MPEKPQPNPTEGLDQTTWAVLLSRWTEFAKASVAIPEGEEGDRWRASVAPVIGLQAIAFALGDLARVAPEERDVALDRAEAGIRTHASEIHGAWRGEPVPDGLREIIDDAIAALRAAREGGTEWTVAVERFEAPDPAPIGEALLARGFDGALLAAAPGTVLFRGAPWAFVRPAAVIDPPDGVAARTVGVGSQVYRQVDEASGEPVRDLVAPLTATLPTGRPLLVPVVEGGRMISSFDQAETARWRDAQARALGDRALPVERSDSAG